MALARKKSVVMLGLAWKMLQMEVQLIRTHRTSQTVAPLNGELRPLQLGLFPLGRLGVHLGPADGDAPALKPTDHG